MCSSGRGESTSVNEHRYPIGWEASVDPGCKVVRQSEFRNPRDYLVCKAFPKSSLKRPKYHRPASADRIGLFHYVVRSQEDFVTKISKSVIGMGGSPKTMDYFDLIDRYESRT